MSFESKISFCLEFFKSVDVVFPHPTSLSLSLSQSGDGIVRRKGEQRNVVFPTGWLRDGFQSKDLETRVITLSVTHCVVPLFFCQLLFCFICFSLCSWVT
jgi:hypothetical protein